MSEALDARITRNERDIAQLSGDVRAMRDAAIEFTTAQRATNARLDEHAENMRSETGAIRKEQVEAAKKLDMLLTRLDTLGMPSARLTGDTIPPDDFTDHGAPSRQTRPPTQDSPSIADHLNRLDTRWVALAALAILVAGGVVGSDLARDAWTWYTAPSQQVTVSASAGH